MWSFGLFVVEFLGGYFSGSMALMSDALHVLLDGTENIVSAIVSFLARKNKDEEKMRRIGGAVSASLLLVAAGVIIHEGYERILEPKEVEQWMILVAIGGFAVNLRQMWLHNQAEDEHRNQTHWWQNMHLMSDAAASLVVIVGGAIMIVARGLYWIDGVLSVGIGGVIVMITIAKLFGIEIHHHSHSHSEGSKCNHKH